MNYLKRLARLSRLVFILVLISSTCFSQDTLKVDVGGALRFNYNMSSWKKEQVKRGGDFGYDLFRINVKGTYGKLGFNAEYRLYSEDFGGGMLKQGWLEYQFNEEHSIQLGLTQVPFGIQQYQSHNWFFNIGYYIGLEDDHDMGIKYILDKERIQVQLAYFKNAEELRFGNNSEHSSNRYSYDVVGTNTEVHQGNGKIIYRLGQSKSSELGLSLMYGGLWNIPTESFGNHNATAVSYEYTKNNWNLKLQAGTVNKNPSDSTGNDKVIEMGAYGAPYNVASKGSTYLVAVAREFPLQGFINKITVYNDFGLFVKSHGYEHSMMNVLGVLVNAGPVYTYVDVAGGKNHAWLGPEWTDAFAQGNPDADFHIRFNINLGIYY